MSSQQITVRVNELSSGDTFLFTAVYGSNDDEERKERWVDLMHIKDGCNVPWCLCGDFNNMLDFHEKIGRPVLWADIADFRACVEYCEVVDVKGQGAFFTWNNKHEPNSRVFSRIDRCLVNADWMRRYSECYAYFLPEGLFDHNPCICYMRIVTKGKTHFRYFNMWGE
ncbi:uncharacterized protein LOC141608231 [Silene latifolia]|uniref:uncharacterized protein LOC141608231 n=1 Tax=Silene latifolia TaxID=37657 RepID=UPI003D77F58A